MVSILPEVLESVRRQLRVANRVLNILVSHICLYCTSVLALGGEVVTRGVPEEVRAVVSDHAPAEVDFRDPRSG